MYKNVQWISIFAAVAILEFAVNLNAYASILIPLQQSTKSQTQINKFKPNTIVLTPSNSKSLENLLRQVAEKSTSNFVEVTDVDIIDVKPETALLLVNLREAETASTSTLKTRSVIFKTSDGGKNWRISLDIDKSNLISNRGSGALIFDESFRLRNQTGELIDKLWLITQWQVEATFPTLFWTSDEGDTWQASDAIRQFLSSKGHNTFTIAEDLRFRNKNEGAVIAKAMDGKTSIYFLQTSDGGKTWKEISELPKWYFEVGNAKKFSRFAQNQFQIISKQAEISVLRSIENIPRILKSR